MIELTKSEKRHARILLHKAAEIEFAHGLSKFDRILTQWKNKEKDNRDAYHELFKAVNSFDKHIALRYDGIGNTQLLFFICELFSDSIIAVEDLSPFRVEIQNVIIKFSEGFE